MQATWLGFAGSTGARGIVDWLISDPLITPFGSELAASFVERLALLPNTYQPQDNLMRIADPLPRAHYGLADDAFVFACFNRNDKIDPSIFAVWMRILLRVPRSQLWLYASDTSTRARLVSEAEKQGLAEDRLVFMERVSKEVLIIITIIYRHHQIFSSLLLWLILLLLLLLAAASSIILRRTWLATPQPTYFWTRATTQPIRRARTPCGRACRCILKYCIPVVQIC